MASDARFEMRMPASLKAKLEKEAARMGLSLSSRAIQIPPLSHAVSYAVVPRPGK